MLIQCKFKGNNCDDINSIATNSAVYHDCRVNACKGLLLPSRLF